MKISEVLQLVRDFTDYMRQMGGDVETYGGEANSKWDYILGVYGPVPVLRVRGSTWYIHCPLQAVSLGWEASHDMSRNMRPREAEIVESLSLSEANYRLLGRAVYLLHPWNKQLRVDLIAACGMEDERTSNWFRATYEKEYASRRRVREESQRKD